MRRRCGPLNQARSRGWAWEAVEVLAKRLECRHAATSSVRVEEPATLSSDEHARDLDEAERRADEARERAEEAARREAETVLPSGDLGGEAPEIDEPESPPAIRQ